MFPHRPGPIGTNPPLEVERRPILTAYAGDNIRIRAQVQTADGEAATPTNSRLEFILSFQRFTPKESAIWSATWHNGIKPLTLSGNSGLVEIEIPEAVTGTLRRGSLIYSLSVTGPLGDKRKTLLEGTLLIEYAPGGPIHDIPYKD